MKHFLPFGVLAVAVLVSPLVAADAPTALLTAHGTVEKVEKDTLTIRPRGVMVNLAKAWYSS